MKEQGIIEARAVEALGNLAKSKIAEFNAVHGRRELNRNKLEALCGQAKKEMDEMIEQLYQEMLEGLGEKELVADKKNSRENL